MKMIWKFKNTKLNLPKLSKWSTLNSPRLSLISLKNLMRWSWTSTLSCNRWPPSTLWLLKSSKSKRKLIRQRQKFKKRQVKFLNNWKKLREPSPNMPQSNNWPKSKSRYLMLMRLNNSSASSKPRSGTWRSCIRRTLSHLIIKWVNLI